MSAAGEAAVARTVALFEPSASALELIARAFTRQMATGLVGEASSLKMLQTFTRQPSGRERGQVVVVDWGGTNARVGLLELDGAGTVRVLAEDSRAFTAEEKRGAAEPVFDLLADGVGRLLRTRGVKAAPLAFAYSYPARLERIDRAVALTLTKGWRLTGIEGEDVAALLGAALRRAGLDGISVAAVANDPVAALMLQSYRARGRDPHAPPVDLGMILGTGTNIAADLGPAGIRNLESGNFDGMASVETAYDQALDRELDEPSPGAQRFEKMVSGQYLGEVLRRVLGDLGRDPGWLHWPTASALNTAFGVDSADLSQIAADETPGLDVVDERLRSLEVKSTTEERRAVRALALAIGRRSARLVAAALLGALHFLDPQIARPRTIAVDGSLWAGFPGFEDLVLGTLTELVGKERAGRIDTVFVKDATSAGAAVIAAVARSGGE